MYASRRCRGDCDSSDDSARYGSFTRQSVADTVEPVLSTFIIAAVPVIIGELIGARVGFDLYRPVADKWVRSQQLAELARQDPIGTKSICYKAFATSSSLSARLVKSKYCGNSIIFNASVSSPC